MAIINYPNRIFKDIVPAIDRQLAKRNLKTVSETNDITATGLDLTISAKNGWIIDSIAFEFSNTTARSYSASIQNGRRVVERYNDYLWFHVTGCFAQRIVLDDGFYDGTELAAHLKAKLDANSAFIAQSITFTVVYDATTGEFTVTPSSGNIKYLDVNEGQTIPNRQSIAGHLFGFTVTTSFAASVTSDTAVFGLDSSAAIINQVSTTEESLYHDDLHNLSIDQSLSLASNTAAVAITHTITYEEII